MDAAAARRKEWRAVPHETPPPHPHSDERTIYEEGAGPPAEVGDEMLRERLGDLVRQQQDLRQMEVGLRAHAMVAEVKGGYEARVKEHAEAAAALKEQLQERERHLREMGAKLDEKDRELRAVKIDNEAAWAKEDLLREQNKEIASFRRERDNLEAERAQHLQKIHELQEHIQEKESQFLALEEQEKDKREAFLKVCKNFRPVMHYFFLERFLQPADWFENRLTYTRSVAASSMVGYIVGLGDRHSMKILIDQATAEVIHIDLGVAFEQGLMLKTPERVPFRLTRDIIDGMGITGVDGVFRRCCEETLSVMRTNKEALLTIIEVFMHDPLYKWALSPLKALQRQKETYDDTSSSLESSQDAYEGNKDATRATLRVKQKLDGYEEGEMRSVQGQICPRNKDWG